MCPAGLRVAGGARAERWKLSHSPSSATRDARPLTGAPSLYPGHSLEGAGADAQIRVVSHASQAPTSCRREARGYAVLATRPWRRVGHGEGPRRTGGPAPSREAGRGNRPGRALSERPRPGRRARLAARAGLHEPLTARAPGRGHEGADLGRSRAEPAGTTRFHPVCVRPAAEDRRPAAQRNHQYRQAVHQPGAPEVRRCRSHGPDQGRAVPSRRRGRLARREVDRLRPSPQHAAAGRARRGGSDDPVKSRRPTEAAAAPLGYSRGHISRMLTQAVAAAYGWSASISHDGDEIVHRLLELNREIAAGTRTYNPFGAQAQAAQELLLRREGNRRGNRGDLPVPPLHASCGGFLRSFRTRILRRISTLIPYTHPAEDFYAHSVHASCGGFLRSFPTSYGSLWY
jgi:hypothetical protein